MLHVDVAAGLCVVSLHVADERVGTLQVEPALVLTAELEGALLQDSLDVDGAADGVVLATDGTGLAQFVDG